MVKRWFGAAVVAKLAAGPIVALGTPNDIGGHRREFAK
jgi:hypothetical protein